MSELGFALWGICGQISFISPCNNDVHISQKSREIPNRKALLQTSEFLLDKGSEVLSVTNLPQAH